MHSSPCSSMLARIAGDTPWARMTTIPDSAAAGSLITFTPRAASRSLIFGLWTTWPRLKTGRPDSAAASVSSTAFFTPKQNPFSRARSTSMTQVYGPSRAASACRAASGLAPLLALHAVDVVAAHRRRKELRDPAHDRVRDLLLRASLVEPELPEVERLADPHADVRAERPRLGRPDHADRKERRIRLAREERDPFTGAAERPMPATGPFRKEAQRVARAQYLQARDDRAAITLAPTYGEAADTAEEPTKEEHPEARSEERRVGKEWRTGWKRERE